MKIHLFHNESTLQPYEVEEDVWVMEPTPEQFGVVMKKETAADDELMKNAHDWCNENVGWPWGNHFYFDTEEDRSRFLMVCL